MPVEQVLEPGGELLEARVGVGAHPVAVRPLRRQRLPEVGVQAHARRHGRAREADAAEGGGGEQEVGVRRRRRRRLHAAHVDAPGGGVRRVQPQLVAHAVQQVAERVERRPVLAAGEREG